MKEKTMNTNPVKICRKFDETFKREAIRKWLNSGRSAPVIAREKKQS
jgi:transposase-like protein